MKHFRHTFNGFQITFENGVTLSTIFGWGTYSENRDNQELEFNLVHSVISSFESNNCEVAIFREERDCTIWLTGEMNKEVFGEDLDDNVKGWVNFADWLKIFNWCDWHIVQK